MLDLYANKSAATLPKLIITLIELALIALSFFILFGDGGTWIANILGWPVLDIIPQRRWVIFFFSIVILVRMAVMMFVFMKRAIPWSEVFSVPFAFAFYYAGFAILVLPNAAPMGWLDWVAIALFILGCYLNTGAELQRHIFKLDPSNKGKLYTGGLFGLSMHINFFGDVVWVLAYALIAMHVLGFALPLLLLAMFVFFNVPKLDEYLRQRYGQPFKDYEARTKRLIPFIW
ncbi:DUF1295 domain-containing protein [Maritalea sp.]|uniref:DUF1295 domain-containing protein n=1 Tax=Maritalea sp. TaxID=2003361 RepID=UPI003EF64262